MEFSRLETSSRIILDDGTVLTRCDQCRTMHGERKPPTIPPCETCEVELREENEEAAQIYQIVRGQVRMLGEQVMDLDFNAVFGVMDRYPGGIKNQWKCFMKIRHLFYHFLNEKRGE